MKEIIKQEADALIQEPITLTIDIPAKNRVHKLLQQKKILPVKKVFQVRPLVLGSLIRISKLLADIDVAKIDKEKFAEVSFELMQGHSETMAKIAAIAVTNEKKEPSKALVNFFLYQLTAKELFSVVQIVLKQMDVQSFLLGIISVRNLNVIETNPETQRG